MELRGKKVVVTGADGFIGSHLTEALVAAGCEVTAFCYYNSFDSRGWLDSTPAEITENIDFFMGDIRDANGVRKALEGKEVVFHLAALIGIPFSYHSPDSYVQTNIGGSLNVLQAARDHGLERVIMTSTSEVYGTALYTPIDEDHPLQGQSPYSATKIGADKLAQSYFLSFGLPVVTARPFNTYGPRQSTRAVIPTAITQLLAGVDELSLGSIHPRRDFNFVEDTVAGFLALAECDEAVGKVVNIGSGVEVSIKETVELIMSLVGRSVPIKTKDERKRPAPSEVERLLCNNGLITSLTGWKSRVPLQEGLARAVDWYRQESEQRRYRLGYTV